MDHPQGAGSSSLHPRNGRNVRVKVKVSERPARATSGELTESLDLDARGLRREIGIRTALGARRSSIVFTIARRSLAQIGVGVLLGMPLAGAMLFVAKSQLGYTCYSWGERTRHRVTAGVTAERTSPVCNAFLTPGGREGVGSAWRSSCYGFSSPTGRLASRRHSRDVGNSSW